MSDVSCKGDEPELAFCARIDGKLNISPQCLSDGKGSQALCEPKNKKVLDKQELFFDIGSTEELRCSIHNETSYGRWTINGQSANSTSQRIRTKETGELFIYKVQLSDAGLYECYRLEYVKFYIVYVNAKFTDNTLDQQILTADTSGIISCSAQGKPSPQIYWSKKGGNSFDHRRFTQVSNGSLHISPVKPEDNGTFICTMKQTKGAKRVTSNDRNILVTIIISPQITKPPINQSVTEGYPVNFSCRASGVPTPTLVWLFNNANLNQTDHEGESLLELPSVTKEMKGTYKCEAKNEANTTSSSATLRVYGKFNDNDNDDNDFDDNDNENKDDEIGEGDGYEDKAVVICDTRTNEEKNRSDGTIMGKSSAQVAPDPYPTLTIGDVLTLTCQVNEDTINVTWKKDGDLLSKRAKISKQWNKKQSKLTINEVLEEDGGSYSCEGHNKLGPDQEQAIQMEPLNVEVDEWEIEVSRVLLQEVIGRGAFGAVWRALLSSPNGRPGNRTVAAKCFT
ncbi:Matrix-remodeling-associated protein 5, partial [Stylophora pistillata]